MRLAAIAANRSGCQGVTMAVTLPPSTATVPISSKRSQKPLPIPVPFRVRTDRRAASTP